MMHPERGNAGDSSPDLVAGFIREQPQVIAATYRSIRAALAARALPARDIALVGSGSSFNALTAQASAFATAARSAVHVRGPAAFMAELAAGHLRPSVAIVLSQSGASVTSIEAAHLAQKCGADVFRITAEGASPFAQLAPDTLVMPIGPEPIGPKTKGYAASLTALAALADWTAGRSGKEPAVRSDLVEHCRMVAVNLADAIPDPDFVLVVGQRAHLGTALEASLKISEMSGIPAAGIETEEALHGRLHGLTPRSLAIFIAGNASEAHAAERLAAIMCDLGVTARILGPAIEADVFRTPDAPIDPAAHELDSITAIVPFQWFAWALARHRGLDPARMRYPGLSQRLAIKTGPPT
jgi:fructoselysine-6-P-deglycase FrlB-like protein